MQIGERLKEAREQKQLSLEDVQEITKIQARYLVAIEQDDFHALPGKFYARAFIKEYAQAVDIDPVEILYGFDEEKIQTQEEETVQYTRLNRAKQPKETKGSSVLSFLPTVIVIILVIGIVFVAWTLSQKTSSDSEGEADDPSDDEIVRSVDEGKEKQSADENEEENVPEDEDETTKDEDDEATEDEDLEGEFTDVEPGTGNSPLSTMTYTYTGDDVEVTLEADDDAYVAVQKEDESSIYEGSMQAGDETDPIDVSDEEKIYFNIGNATGVTIFINGVELEYPVERTESVHQKMWVNLNKQE